MKLEPGMKPSEYLSKLTISLARVPECSSGGCTMEAWILRNSLEAQLPELVQASASNLKFDINNMQEYLNDIDRAHANVRSRAAMVAASETDDLKGLSQRGQGSHGSGL